MARKFLQMGYTRSRRYTNHKSGKKYTEDGKTVLPRIEDPIKAESARIFYGKWQRVKADLPYQYPISNGAIVIDANTRMIGVEIYQKSEAE